MRILLRNPDTGAFFKTNNDWTTDPMEALDFQDRGRAMRVSQAMGWINIEIHVTSDDGQPLPEKAPHTAS